MPITTNSFGVIIPINTRPAIPWSGTTFWEHEQEITYWCVIEPGKEVMANNNPKRTCEDGEVRPPLEEFGNPNAKPNCNIQND